MKQESINHRSLMWSLVWLVSLWHGGTTLATARAGTYTDAKVFAVYDQLNSYDIEAAKLALERGKSEHVLAVGRMITTDHAPILEQARELASTLGISYAVDADNPLSKAHGQAMTALQEKSGDAFDKAYIEHEISFSEEFIRIVKQDLLPNIENPKLKAYMEDVVPRFEEHLSHINHAAAGIGLREAPAGSGHDHAHHHGH